MTDVPSEIKLIGFDARYLRLQFRGNPPPKGEYVTTPASALGELVIPGLAYPFPHEVTYHKHLFIMPNAPTRYYDPAHKCIYCGATVHSEGRRDLGEEHVMAGALGGNLVLPLASCLVHERNTSGIETKIIQRMFDPTRKHLDIRGKNKKPLLKGNFEISHQVGGKDIKLRLPIEEHPTILFLSLLAPPGIVTGRPKWMHGMTGAWAANLNAEPEQIRKHGLQNVITPPLDNVLFSQFLAKIAHATACAEVLLDNFSPLLPEFIARKHGTKEVDDDRYYLVGGDPVHVPPGGSLHEISLGLTKASDGYFLIARIRLLSFLGAPFYYVAVGKVAEPRHAAVIERLSRNNSRTQAR